MMINLGIGPVAGGAVVTEVVGVIVETAIGKTKLDAITGIGVVEETPTTVICDYH